MHKNRIVRKTNEKELVNVFDAALQSKIPSFRSGYPINQYISPFRLQMGPIDLVANAAGSSFALHPITLRLKEAIVATLRNPTVPQEIKEQSVRYLTVHSYNKASRHSFALPPKFFLNDVTCLMPVGLAGNSENVGWISLFTPRPPQIQSSGSWCVGSVDR